MGCGRLAAVDPPPQAVTATSGKLCPDPAPRQGQPPARPEEDEEPLPAQMEPGLRKLPLCTGKRGALGV